MKKYIAQHGFTAIPYYVSGFKPNILIISGKHGDEFEVIDSMRKAIVQYGNKMPPFMFIPEVSPSAVAQKTRHNKDNVDINRHFFDNSPVEEAQAVMELLRRHSFDACFSFHEDVEHPHFYLYSTEQLDGTTALSLLKQEIKALGVGLFTGIDDPTDPLLGHDVLDGYRWVNPNRTSKDNGTLHTWALGRNIVRRFCTPEVPGKISPKVKNQIVDAVFRHLILHI